MKSNRLLSFLAIACALVFVISASKCESTTEFIPYKPEICTDNIDNDADSLIDCKDPDCSRSCGVGVTIDSLSSMVKTDSVIVTGTQNFATNVVVTVSPSGLAGKATISGNTWQAKLTQLLNPGLYTVKAVASDSANQTSTKTMTFERAN